MDNVKPVNGDYKVAASTGGTGSLKRTAPARPAAPAPKNTEDEQMNAYLGQLKAAHVLKEAEDSLSAGKVNDAIRIVNENKDIIKAASPDIDINDIIKAFILKGILMEAGKLVGEDGKTDKSIEHINKNKDKLVMLGATEDDVKKIIEGIKKSGEIKTLLSEIDEISNDGKRTEEAVGKLDANRDKLEGAIDVDNTIRMVRFKGILKNALELIGEDGNILKAQEYIEKNRDTLINLGMGKAVKGIIEGLKREGKVKVIRSKVEALIKENKKEEAKALVKDNSAVLSEEETESLLKQIDKK